MSDTWGTTPLSKPKHLFVYGTLRDAHPNSKRFGLTEVAKPDAKLMGFTVHNLGWFPGIVPGEGFVVGDVFHITDDLIPGLDAYEGVPSLYRREVHDVGSTPCYVYVYNGTPPPGSEVTDGDWLNTHYKQG